MLMIKEFTNQNQGTVQTADKTPAYKNRPFLWIKTAGTESLPYVVVLKMTAYKNHEIAYKNQKTPDVKTKLTLSGKSTVIFSCIKVC